MQVKSSHQISELLSVGEGNFNYKDFASGFVVDARKVSLSVSETAEVLGFLLTLEREKSSVQKTFLSWDSLNVYSLTRDSFLDL